MRNLNVRDAVDNAPLLDPLDEGVAGPVVGDGKPQGVFRLCDLNLLGPALYWSLCLHITGHIYNHWPCSIVTVFINRG